jgi:hypothetical protein
MQVQCTKCSQPIALTDIIESHNPVGLLEGEIRSCGWRRHLPPCEAEPSAEGQ